MRMGIDDCIQIRTELLGIDARSATGSIRNGRARHKPASLDRS